MHRIKERAREEGRERARIRACVGRTNESEKKKKIAGWKEGLHRGFWFSRFIWTKSRFPDFPSFPRREPALELDVHCASTETRAREVAPTPLLTSWRRILSRVRPFNGVYRRSPKYGYAPIFPMILSHNVVEFRRWTWNSEDEVCSHIGQARYNAVKMIFQNIFQNLDWNSKTLKYCIIDERILKNNVSLFIRQFSMLRISVSH